MAKIDALHGWDQIRAYLPANYEGLANEHRQVETQYGNAKIRTADDLLRFILLHVGANLPLRQTVALMAEAGGPSLAPMRLHKKMCRAAPYLRALVERMVDWPTEGAAERWGGYVFTAVDATVVCGPAATGIDARVHLKLRVADVSIGDVQVTDDKGGESFCRFAWEPGELAVGDRAYCTARGVDHVTSAGADVLVRYRLGGLTLCMPEGEPLDVLERARGMGDGEVLDLDVHALLERRHIKGRFIVMRLPPDAADRARKRLIRENGNKLRGNSRPALEACGYVMLFTTAKRERLNAERCLHGYRLRWQIELQFKRWKSLCSFDRLPNQRDDTTLSWLYAKVLLGALLDRMASIPSEVSPPEPHTTLGDRPTDVARPMEADEYPLSTRRGRATSHHAA
jgi:hypothetical protein